MASQVVGSDRSEIAGKKCCGAFCGFGCESCVGTGEHETIPDPEHQITTATGDSVPVLKTITAVVISSREFPL